MRARTGLWEPWVSNHPGPPGPPARNETLSGYVYGQLRTLDTADADVQLHPLLPS